MALWQFWVNLIFLICLEYNAPFKSRYRKKACFFSGISCDVILSCHLSSTKKFVVANPAAGDVRAIATFLSIHLCSAGWGVPDLDLSVQTFQCQHRCCLGWYRVQSYEPLFVECHCKDPKGPDNMMGEFCAACLKTRMSSLHRKQYMITRERHFTFQSDVTCWKVTMFDRRYIFK